MRAYKPPAGRPISRPPDDAQKVVLIKASDISLDEVERAVRRKEGVVSDYVAGMPVPELMQKHNAKAYEVYRFVKKAGVKLRHPDWAWASREGLRRRKSEPSLLEQDEMFQAQGQAMEDGRPTRRPDETAQQLAARVVRWKRTANPEYDKNTYLNRSRGQKKRAHKAAIYRLAALGSAYKRRTQELEAELASLRRPWWARILLFWKS